MPTWTLHTVFTFDAAHYIDGYDGKCANMHGHTYKVQMTAKSSTLHPSKYLPTADMVCDFKELKWPASDTQKGGFDHGLLNDVMETATTAERLAELIHKRTVERIPSTIQLTVTVWETPTSWVEYTDE